MRNLGQAFQGSFKLLGAIPVEWAESDILHLIAEHDQRRD